MKLFKKLGLAFVLCLILILSFSAALAAGTDVAKIGSTGYATLGEAVAAANAMTVGADETIQHDHFRRLHHQPHQRLWWRNVFRCAGCEAGA